MIDALREWITAITLCSLLLAPLKLLTPKGPVRQITVLAGNLVLLLCILHPLTGEIRLAPDTQKLRQELEMAQETVTRQAQEHMEAGIAERTEAYISAEAERRGLRLTVSVTVEKNGDGLPVPAEAELWGGYSPELSRLLDRELGISPERQVWHEGKS